MWVPEGPDESGPVSALVIGWGELAQVRCPNHSVWTLGGWLSIKYGSKSLKVGLCIPWGQRVPVQHHRIGVDAMILLLEQNHRDPGPRRKDTDRNAATSLKRVTASRQTVT